MELKGKTAVVTGATGGLGYCICRALGKHGVKVVMVYNKSKEKGEANLRAMKASGYEAALVQADVTTQAGIDGMLAAAEKSYGGLDILVLDAAYNRWIPFSDLETLDGDTWNYILNFNLAAPYLAARSAAPLMKKRGSGRIITVASNAGLQPYGSSIAYAVSKAALIHLTRCLAVALAPEVLVNCVSPGLMEGTRMTDNLAPEFAQKVRDAALLGKAADKEDVAEAAVLFAETESITGQNLVIDSGRFFH